MLATFCIDSLLPYVLQSATMYFHFYSIQNGDVRRACFFIDCRLFVCNFDVCYNKKCLSVSLQRYNAALLHKSLTVRDIPD